MIRAARRVALLTILVILAAAPITCSELDALLQESARSNGGRVPADAGKALKKLEVSPPGSMAGYDREDFPHWSDAQEFGWDVSDESCDVRDAALIRDGEDVLVGEDCDVESGRWLDPYTSRTYTDPLDIDIDTTSSPWRTPTGAGLPNGTRPSASATPTTRTTSSPSRTTPTRRRATRDPRPGSRRTGPSGARTRGAG